MRELKFRAWDDKDEIEEGEMVHFDLSLIHTKRSDEGIFQGDAYLGLALRHLPLMQYTGLKDKNGVEIYEGDVLKYKSLLDNDEVGYVSFSAGSFRLKRQTFSKSEGCGEIRMWNDGDHDWYSIENLESFEMEIIGNIHQHPELLTSNKESK